MSIFDLKPKMKLEPLMGLFIRFMEESTKSQKNYDLVGSTVVKIVFSSMDVISNPEGGVF